MGYKYDIRGAWNKNKRETNPMTRSLQSFNTMCSCFHIIIPPPPPHHPYQPLKNIYLDENIPKRFSQRLDQNTCISLLLMNQSALSKGPVLKPGTLKHPRTLVHHARNTGKSP